MIRSKIVITGVGSIYAGGLSVDSQKNCIVYPRGPQPVPDYLFNTQLSFPAFILPEQIFSTHSLNYLSSISSFANVEQLNRTTQLCLEAVILALGNASLSPDDFKKYKIGISLGTTVGCTFNNEDYYLQWRAGHPQKIDPIYHYIGNNLSSIIQEILKLDGPCVVITNACSSSTDALGLGKNWLDQGLCDIVIAGGADELSRVAYHGFASLGLLSNTQCQPFDINRAGLNLGEGAGILILEKEDLRRRKANPLGCVLGYAIASDYYHPTSPEPNGRGMIQAFRKALVNSGITGDEVGYINAHGTGTHANDSAETVALSKVNLNSGQPIVSTKGLTGHMLGAAGAIEAIITLETIQRGECEGTFGCKQMDPDFPCKILEEKEVATLKSRIGISQSLAFGGGNSALVLEGFK